MTIESNGADTVATTLFTTLTAGASFAVPVVDMTGAEYQPPTSTDNSLYSVVPSLSEASLTSRKAGGTGMFDGLMATIGDHLQTEYAKGRITGKEYAEAWASSIQAALGSSVQYLLSKDSAHYQAKLVQIQARMAELQAVSERVNIDISKSKLVLAQIEANTAAANFALTKLQLAREDAQFAQVVAQTAQITYQNANLLPEQLTGLQKDNATKAYQLTYLLPKELEKTNKQIEAASAEISATVAKKDQTIYETVDILPTQKAGLLADNAIKTYTLNTQLPAQVAGVTADNASKAYTNSFLLPAQLESIKEQNEGHRAKTLDTRSDGLPVNGAIGKSIDLQQEQINSYKRDAEAKVAKMLLDGWMTQRSTDENLAPPTGLADAQINSALTKIRSNLDL